MRFCAELWRKPLDSESELSVSNLCDFQRPTDLPHANRVDHFNSTLWHESNWIQADYN